MRTGIRFTCLKNGDPLLGQTWEYKTLNGVEAIDKKLQDMFYYANKLMVTDIIDTINISKTSDNELYIGNSGINGELWPFNQRIETYKTCCSQYNFNMLIEIEFPTAITEENISQYAQYAIKIIDSYSWIKYWQIMTQPESLDDSGVQKCSPVLYVKLIKSIYEIIHNKYSDINIGGPGILSAITEYVNSAYVNIDKQTYHTGWLAEATGEMYGTSSQYNDIGKNGFLDYIDFFAFQGRQNYSELNYNVYPTVITKLKEGLITQTQRNGTNLNVPYFSTYQGHYADKSNVTDMQLQGYRDLREIMNAYSVNVVPFKTQLVDEFYNPDDTNLEKNVYGLLYYYLGNYHKPSYDTFKFVLNRISEFTRLPDNTISIKNKLPFESSTSLNSVMLMNKDGTKIVTVIFPSTERDLSSSKNIYTTVTLKTSMNRKYYLQDGTIGILSSPLDITFKKYDFVIVEETIQNTIVITNDVKNEITKRLTFYEKYTKELLKMLPSTYNKEVYDTNFYKLLRSVGVEMGDAEYDRNILEDNMYLSTAHGDAIYNNFGALIGVEWQSRWGEEKYRNIVSGIIESLLNGATKNSITKAIKLFTSFDVHVYELFTDYKHYGLSKESNYDNQYRFTIEIEKSIDDKTNIDTLYDDVKYVTDIVKPAHTIPIIMVVLVGTEDYKKWYKERYGKEFSNSDELIIEQKVFSENNIYGWKFKDYDYLLKTNSSSNINSAYLIGPKYTLYDRSYNDFYMIESEHYQIKDETYINDVNMNFNDSYLFKPKDIYKIGLEMYFSEAKFGVKPSKLDELLMSNGQFVYSNNEHKEIIGNELRTVNSYKTGFAYELYDDFDIQITMIYNENYNKYNDIYEVMFNYDFNEKYTKPKDSTNMLYELECSELKYGLVPYYDETFYSHGGNTYSTLNSYRIGVMNRLFDYNENDININYNEKFKSPIESCSMKLFSLDKNGNENIIQQITF